MSKKIKQKKCKVCKELFTPFNTLANACSVECALVLVKKDNQRKADKQAKERRKQHREARKKLKTRTEYLKEAQIAFNAYIRERDKGKPCISCDKPDNGQHQRQASHYRSVKACSILRFNTFNVHASCAQCNTILSGNLIEYRIRLKGKLGDDRVEWLECQNDTRRYDIDYLIRLKKIFNKRTRILKNRV